MKRLLLILNPCSGKKRANRALAEIVSFQPRRLRRHGLYNGCPRRRNASRSIPLPRIRLRGLRRRRRHIQRGRLRCLCGRQRHAHRLYPRRQHERLCQQHAPVAQPAAGRARHRRGRAAHTGPRQLQRPLLLLCRLVRRVHPHCILRHVAERKKCAGPSGLCARRHQGAAVHPQPPCALSARPRDRARGRLYLRRHQQLHIRCGHSDALPGDRGHERRRVRAAARAQAAEPYGAERLRAGPDDAGLPHAHADVHERQPSGDRRPRRHGLDARRRAGQGAGALRRREPAQRRESHREPRHHPSAAE